MGMTWFFVLFEGLIFSSKRAGKGEDPKRGEDPKQMIRTACSGFAIAYVWGAERGGRGGKK
jgi:hypothetical protein